MKAYHIKFKIIFFATLLLSNFLVSQSSKPNFLIVLGDDISATNIGCYNSKNLNTTPNIDQLANEGIQFTNMFVTEAICAPRRAELFTGLMPNNNGCNKNHAATEAGTLSIVQHLEKKGYRVALTGKMHFKPQSTTKVFN